LKKFTAFYLLNKFPVFIDPQDSLSCSQKSAIGPHPEPSLYIPHLQILCLFNGIRRKGNYECGQCGVYNGISFQKKLYLH